MRPLKTNGTLSYLNRVINTTDQGPRILLINALIFSHVNYCRSIWGECSENLQYDEFFLSTLHQKEQATGNSAK